MIAKLLNKIIIEKNILRKNYSNIELNQRRLWPPNQIQYVFSQKKPEDKHEVFKESKKQFSTYRSFNQRILEILYVYILNKYHQLGPNPKPESRKRKKQKSGFRFSGAFKKLLWTIFGGGTIFYAELQQALFTRMYESLKKRLNENEEISKGKHIENKILSDLQAEYKQNKQMMELYTNQLTYLQQIENIIRLRDFKTLIFIQSFASNGLGFNIKRIINDRMHVRPLMFQKFYYINLKDPPAYELSKEQQDENWHEARQLHYLMNTLIGMTSKRAQPNILVIDEIQVLQHFLDDQERSETLKNIVKQINELQKLKHTKIICICNSKTFPQKMANILRSNNKLDLFKHYFIGKLSPDNLLKIVSKRTKYEDLIEMELKNLKKNNNKKQIQLRIKQNKRKFHEIMEFIISQHDSLSEIFRILRSSGIDYKEYFLKYQNLLKNSLLQNEKDSFFCYNPFYSQEYEYIIQETSEKNQEAQIHLPSLKFIEEKSKIISDRIIQQKVEYIRKTTNVSFHKRSTTAPMAKDSAQLKMQKELQKAKLYILQKVYQSGYECDGECDLATYAKKIKVNLEDRVQLQAYLDLNRDNVLHGLVFNDKSMFRAYERIKKERQPKNKKKFYIF